MPCFSPLEAYRSLEPNSNGKYPLVFGKESSDTGEKVEVPCGRCHGCRLERSRQWAMRCVHEASLYEDNCFITLTYSPENLPEDGSLHKDHFQKFMKRLRKKYAPKTIRFYMCGEYGEENLPEDGSLHKDHFQRFMKRLRKKYAPKTIRFYMCGEYGEENGRPHFHALLFNHDFSDKTLWSVREDVSLFVSEELNKLWPFGYCIIGDVTFESAAYVARYVMKKVTGDAADEHYSRVDPESGEITFLTPEYNSMSRRPGLAFDWYEKYKGCFIVSQSRSGRVVVLVLEAVLVWVLVLVCVGVCVLVTVDV